MNLVTQTNIEARYQRFVSKGFTHNEAMINCRLYNQKPAYDTSPAWPHNLFPDRPYTKEIAGADEMSLRMQDRWKEPERIMNQVVPVDRMTSEQVVEYYQRLAGKIV